MSERELQFDLAACEPSSARAPRARNPDPIPSPDTPDLPNPGDPGPHVPPPLPEEEQRRDAPVPGGIELPTARRASTAGAKTPRAEG